LANAIASVTFSQQDRCQSSAGTDVAAMQSSHARLARQEFGQGQCRQTQARAVLRIVDAEQRNEAFDHLVTDLEIARSALERTSE
jgi:hypothetical protein